MRILHTSDWHLGRSFHGASLLDEQAEAIDRIVALTAEHRVELVVIAGDLYDRAIPPSSAVDLFDDALARLHAAGASVAAISGNHDSAVRVGVSDRLLNRLGVAVRGDVTRVAEPLILTAPADGGPPVAVYLVPYLEPSVDVPTLTRLLAEQQETSGSPVATDGPITDGPAPEGSTAARSTDQPVRRATHDRATKLATDLIRRHLGALGPARSVVVAHGFVAGGAVSDSERDLSVGGSDRVSVDAFAGFDLVTLGHLHQPQRIDGDRVTYSGTPLPYSFSEQHHTKSVRLVELAPDGSVSAQTIPLGVGRPLRTITGDLADLLADASLEDAVPARVRAVLTDPHLPTAAMARLRTRFAHAVELQHRPAGVDPSTRQATTDLTTLERLSPTQLAQQFWSEQQGADATEAEAHVLAAAVAANLTAFTEVVP